MPKGGSHVPRSTCCALTLARYDAFSIARTGPPDAGTIEPFARSEPCAPRTFSAATTVGPRCDQVASVVPKVKRR
jgi:hypothetical protein